jgi:hypothetical protein
MSAEWLIDGILAAMMPPDAPIDVKIIDLALAFQWFHALSQARCGTQGGA